MLIKTKTKQKRIFKKILVSSQCIPLTIEDISGLLKRMMTVYVIEKSWQKVKTEGLEDTNALIQRHFSWFESLAYIIWI